MMKKISCKKITRPCVEGFEPYIPGRPVCEIKKRYKLKKIIKLASNENTLGPSKKIFAPLEKEVKNIFLYPLGNAAGLRQALAIRLGICADEIIAGSGTDELIEIIAKTFLNADDEIVVSKHAFIRYKMAGELMGAIVKEVPMRGYRHDLAGMLSIVTPKTKVVFIANPNNPTGTYVTGKELESFLGSLPHNVIVCLDEAYFEYAKGYDDYPDGIKLYRKGYKNLVVLRTFSKIYALAGLRVGYAVCDRGIASAMDRIRPPFNVNSLAQKAAEISIKDNSQVKRGRELSEKGKKSFYAFLEKNKIAYLKSAANFVLIKVSGCGYSGGEFFNRLLERGIIVRSMEEYELDDWVRITISGNKDMQCLHTEIEKLIEERKNECS